MFLFPADVQQKSDVPPQQQECNSSPDREEPEPPHIKEEQEELWTNQEEDDVTRFTFTPVPVKSEDDEEEKPLSSQMETEADGEFCAGPEPDRNSDPDRHFETEDCDGEWTESSRVEQNLDWTYCSVPTNDIYKGLNNWNCVSRQNLNGPKCLIIDESAERV